MTDPAKYIEKEFLSSEELVSSTMKTRTLNILSDTLNGLEKGTANKDILGLINVLRNVIEDAYVISMYKFQFKAFTTAIESEVEAIRQMVEHAK